MKKADNLTGATQCRNLYKPLVRGSVVPFIDGACSAQ